MVHIVASIVYMCSLHTLLCDGSTSSHVCVVSPCTHTHTPSGLLMFNCLLVLVYAAGVGLYAHRLWVTITKGGPMHEVLQMLSVAMALHLSSTLLMLLHLWRSVSHCCQVTGGRELDLFIVLGGVNLLALPNAMNPGRGLFERWPSFL